MKNTKKMNPFTHNLDYVVDIDNTNVETLPTALIEGSIAFSNGLTLAEDNANLFWDDTNDRLGIGTTSPDQALEVVGSIELTTGDLYLDNGQRIYFKNSVGAYKTVFQASGETVNFRGLDNGMTFQDVNGNSLMTNSAGSGLWEFRDTTATTGATRLKIKGGAGQSTTDLFLVTDASDKELMSLGSAGGIFNENGEDFDFRFEGDTDPNLLHLDGGIDAVGIGTAANAIAKLFFVDSTKITSGTRYGIELRQTFNPATNSTAIVRGLNLSYNSGNGGGNIGDARGMTFIVSHNGNNLSLGSGIRGDIQTTGSATATTLTGGGFAVTKAATGALTNATALEGRTANTNATGGITNSKVFYALSPTATGTITNQYGFFASNQGAANITNAYGLYITEPTGATNNYGAYIGGNVGIGTSSPSASADLTLEGGALCVKETTTPTADTNYGKIYTKNDNKLYFQDGAGTEHEISLAT